MCLSLRLVREYPVAVRAAIDQPTLGLGPVPNRIASGVDTRYRQLFASTQHTLERGHRVREHLFRIDYSKYSLIDGECVIRRTFPDDNARGQIWERHRFPCHQSVSW